MVNEPEKKMFYFKVGVVGVPYNPDTVEYLYGKGARYIPDYPKDLQAVDILSDMIRDAILHVLQAKTDFLVRIGPDTSAMSSADKQMLEWYQEKYENYKQIQQSIERFND